LDFSTITDENERKVAEFLDKIGFSFIESRSIFNKSEAEIAREIDLLFTFQNCLFIIEVSTVKSGHNFKIITFMYRWSKQKNFERLKEKHLAVSNNVMRIFFDLSKDTPENKSQDVEELTEDQGNMVIYRDVFEKLNSNDDIEQTIADFLGTDWFSNTEKFVE
jgi:Holliday junction resolvase-like predicted endonuclease